MKITILAAVVLIASCETKNIESSYTKTIVRGLPISIYTIDSCEYLGSLEGVPSQKYLAHKGNCRFCTERNKPK